jgi:hypothetical protein
MPIVLCQRNSMITYYNPHVDDFLAEPVQFRLLGRRALKKYGFMINEARACGQMVNVLVDGTASGLIPEAIFHNLPRYLRLVLAALEFKLWKSINGFGDDVQRVDIPKAPIGDVLLAFSYKAATGRFALREATLQHYRAVVFHLSHYFLDTAEKAINIRRLPNAYLAGDSDVTDISYFKRYFDWYNKPFLVLPFAVGKRFINQQPWTSRDGRAVATGSFHDLRLEQPAHKYADFMATTGATTYHPVRLAIYLAAERLAPWINCKISPYREYGQSSLSRQLSHFRVAQKKYFSINIVELYNQHRYAIVGEELNGFPALGAFEAMACGCLLLAQPQYYKGLGLLPDRHYITYSGNVEDIPNVFLEAKRLQLDEISTYASDYIKIEFNEIKVYSKWLHEIKKLVEIYPCKIN